MFRALLSRSNLTDTWLVYFLSSISAKPSHLFDWSIAEALRRSLRLVWQMEGDRE